MALGPQRVAPELLTKVTKALGITSLDQWYYVSQHAIRKAIGSQALKHFGGTTGFLKSAYPQHQFDERKLALGRSHEREQNFVEVAIQKLFPNEEIHTKARKSVGIVNPETNAYLEIDIWIPSLKLGIEYQDKHHYGYQWYANEALGDYQKRDNYKKDAMSSLGYTLITVGYWWDKTLESLAATIRELRPDLLQEFHNISADPIPTKPPAGFTSPSVIPGVVDVMSPFVPIGEFNPTNWYAGEKHDGIRGVYNPALRKLFSRSGNELSILPALLNDIPNMLVEGEIIAGRGNYDKTTAVSYHTHHERVNWSMLRYVVFDIPDAKLGEYAQRYSLINSGLSARPFIFTQPAFRVLVVDKAHLKMLVDSIINDAGEGMIVQQDATYEYGRAKTLAKIKVHRDADAQVLNVNDNSCTCKLVSGVTADINFADGFNASVLQTGDLVSYYHTGHTKHGHPKRGEIYKVRYDLTWENLVGNLQNVMKERSVKELIGRSSLTTRDKDRKKIGYWNRSSNVRAFLDEFARNSGFDPLVPENWYPVKSRDLENAGSGGLLGAYRRSMRKAIISAYPELKFDVKKFRTRDETRGRNKIGHWSELPNARAFFDNFAVNAGFDPLVAENWYQVRNRALRKAGSGGLLSAYNYSKTKALSSAYPELRFELEKFKTRDNTDRNEMGYWNNPQNVRGFLSKFARRAGFDPLVAENWYSVKAKALRDAGGGGLLGTSSHVMKALSLAYPDVKFNEAKFKTRGKARIKSWKKVSNVRAFFDYFARNAGFDPLISENWYSVTTEALRKAGSAGLLGAYSHSMMKALTSAYPELKFDTERFSTRKRQGYWSEPRHVRAFFDEFASKASFDPLVVENWYPVRPRAIRNAGGSGLIYAHGYDLNKALSLAYPDLKFDVGKFIISKSKQQERAKETAGK